MWFSYVKSCYIANIIFINLGCWLLTEGVHHCPEFLSADGSIPVLPGNKSYSTEIGSVLTLSNRANASLNSAVCSSVRWSAMVLCQVLLLENVYTRLVGCHLSSPASGLPAKNIKTFLLLPLYAGHSTPQ